MLASAWLLIVAAIMFVSRLGKYQEYAGHVMNRIIITAVNNPPKDDKPGKTDSHDDETTGLNDSSYNP